MSFAATGALLAAFVTLIVTVAGAEVAFGTLSSLTVYVKVTVPTKPTPAVKVTVPSLLLTNVPADVLLKALTLAMLKASFSGSVAAANKLIVPVPQRLKFLVIGLATGDWLFTVNITRAVSAKALQAGAWIGSVTA